MSLSDRSWFQTEESCYAKGVYKCFHDVLETDGCKKGPVWRTCIASIIHDQDALGSVTLIGT